MGASQSTKPDPRFRDYPATTRHLAVYYDILNIVNGEPDGERVIDESVGYGTTAGDLTFGEFCNCNRQLGEFDEFVLREVHFPNGTPAGMRPITAETKVGYLSLFFRENERVEMRIDVDLVTTIP